MLGWFFRRKLKGYWYGMVTVYIWDITWLFILYLCIQSGVFNKL